MKVKIEEFQAPFSHGDQLLEGIDLFKTYVPTVWCSTVWLLLILEIILECNSNQAVSLQPLNTSLFQAVQSVLKFKFFSQENCLLFASESLHLLVKTHCLAWKLWSISSSFQPSILYCKKVIVICYVDNLLFRVRNKNLGDMVL